MGRLKGPVVASVARGMSLFPTRALRAMETAAALGQGKGWGAGTSAHEVAAALSLLPPNARRHVVAVDAGANIGNWTAEFLKQCPLGRVVAFEPSEFASSKFRARFANDERVVLVQQGLGRAPGEATLWSDVPGSPLGTLERPKLDRPGATLGTAETVNVTTLDAWSDGTDLRCGLLKMDVEGWELEVLAGASRLLRGIKVIQFEFGPANLHSRTFFQDYWRLLSSDGFGILRLTPSGLASVDSYSEVHESFRTTNFFAVRR